MHRGRAAVTASLRHWRASAVAFAPCAMPTSRAPAVGAPPNRARRAVAHAPSWRVASPCGSWSTAVCVLISRARYSSATPLLEKQPVYTKPCAGVPTSARLRGWSSNNSPPLVLSCGLPAISGIFARSSWFGSSRTRQRSKDLAAPPHTLARFLTIPPGNRGYFTFCRLLL